MAVGILVGACSRYRTSEEIRLASSAPGDSSFMAYPCQALIVDEFGWTLDSLDGVQYRIHPSLRPYGHREVRALSYRSTANRGWLRLQLPVGYKDLYPLVKDLQQYNTEQCSIGDRPATVFVGRRMTSYETTVVWSDIGDGRQMIATATAPTKEDMLWLRGTFFTMRFPGETSRRVDE